MSVSVILLCHPTVICECSRLTLELRLAERGGVASDNNELGLAGPERLDGRLVTKGDLAGLHHKRKARVDL